MASNFVKKLDKWCDNQWIVFLCVTATVVAVLAAVFWDVMPLGSKAGVFVAFIMAFHVLEEWKFPAASIGFTTRASSARKTRASTIRRVIP